MNGKSIFLFYFLVVLAGIFLFITVRWISLNNNPRYYENTDKKVMTPTEVEAAGLIYDAEKQYFSVLKKKIYLKSGKFPIIEKEVNATQEFIILPE